MSRISIIYKRHGNEYPLTVDFSCAMPIIEINRVDISELINTADFLIIAKQAGDRLRQCAIEDVADFQQAMGY